MEHRGKGLFIFLFALCALLFAHSAFAREVTLQWDPNSEPDLSHYVVYWGTESGKYTDCIRVETGLKPVSKIVLSDNGKVYYFAVTAVDTAGLESDYSSEVHTPDLPPPKFIFKKKTG